jgi:predicted nucleotidyltransferase component of viral defense system
MSKADLRFPRLHEDTQLFSRAVGYTAVRTGFPALLIEKDYFCTALLAFLAGEPSGIVFKGGTCLAKVMTDFYRLSEDLDFVIPLPFEASRKERRAAVAALKEALPRLEATVPGFTTLDPLVGANRSTQYITTIGYKSPASGQPESITIEVSLREPLLTPVTVGSARSILRNPVTDQPAVAEVPLPCISLQEALAEKARAALTRREVAIRDFYDLFHAAKHLGLDIQEETFLGLVRRKLAIPDNDPIDISHRRLAELRRQVETRLKSVLRPLDFEKFDVLEAIDLVQELAANLGHKIEERS